MKRFLTATALIVATSGAAMAANHAQLIETIQQQLEGYAVEINYDALTPEQAAELHAAVTSSDSHGVRDQKVRAILAENPGLVMNDEDRMSLAYDTPMDQRKAIVVDAFERMGLDYSVDSLSGNEVTEVYLLVTGTDDETAVRDRLRAYFG